MSRLLTLLDADQTKRFYDGGYWQDETIYMVLRRRAHASPDAIAFRDANTCLTYKESLTQIDELAADMHAAGLREGQRVSVWLPSRVETAIIMLACSRMGYVANTSLHRDYTCRDIVDLLKRANSAAFFAQQGFGADAEKNDIFKMVKSFPGLKKIYCVSPLVEGRSESAFHLGFGTLAGEKDLPYATAPDRIVYLAFTSGTTGLPKGVMHSNNTLLANARATVREFGLDQKTVYYTPSPMSHNIGIVALVTSIACGGTFVVHTPLDTKRMLDRIVETKTNFLASVPTHAIDLLADAQRRGLRSLGDVKIFQMGGAPISSHTVLGMRELSVTSLNTFGMTENCSFLFTQPGDPLEIIVGTCGRPCEGMEVKIWDQELGDIEVRPGEIGEMGVRGASLMLGYFDDQGATEGSFNQNGWFMTGDLGVMDERGNIQIAGRKKDIIIRGGHNIHPAHIEELAMRHENVSNAAAFPVADERLGEKVCLALLVKKKGGHTSEEILAHLDQAGLSRYEMPEYYIELESFPLTASGKVLKRALVEMTKDGSIAPHPVRWQPLRS